MKIGNITFKFGALSNAFAVIGFIALFISPLAGIALLAVGILMSSDWRHRQLAQGAVGIMYLLFLHTWLLLFALAVGGFLYYRKVPHALAYTFLLVAAAALFSGSWLLPIFAAATGIFLWKKSLT